MPEKSLILFDGVCNLCNGFVNFVLPRDKKNVFHFGSLQSPGVARLLESYNYSPSNLSTVLLIEDGRLFTRSTAVLRIARKLGGGFALVYPLIFLPAFIRDALYDLVARYRYSLFGKREACMLPRPEWKSRFMD